MNAQDSTQVGAVTEHVVTVDVGEDGDASFEFAFRMDRTGSCRDLDCGGESIAFTWDISAINGLEGETRHEALRELAQELFWDQINEQLDDDRVLESVDFGSEEVWFETGSREELENLVRLVLYSFPSIWDEDRGELSLTIYSGTECEEASIDDNCDFMLDAEIVDEIRQAICGLIDYALGWNTPSGSHLEYNDGAAGRASGYSETPNAVCCTVPRPSFHELAEAREQLLAIFADNERSSEAERLLRAGE